MDPVYIELTAKLNEQRLPARDALSQGLNTVLLGAAGSGKSMLFREITKDSDAARACVVAMRDIGDFNASIEQVVDGAGFLGPLSAPSSAALTIRTDGVSAKIEIYLDGVDEILPLRKNEFLPALGRWMEELPSATWIISSRYGASSLPTSGFQTVHLLPLTDAQIIDFSSSYDIPKDLIEKLTQDSEFGTLTKIPLFAELMCSLFDVYGDLPVRRRSVYSKYVRLLIEDWDQSRSVIRSGMSSNDMLSLLENLALKLLVDQTFEISREQLRQASEITYFNEVDDLDQVLADPRFTSLFPETGRDSFSFVHRSLQEYLAASAVVRLPDPISKLQNFDAPVEVLEWMVDLASDPRSLLLEMVQQGHLKMAMRLFEHSPNDHGLLKNELIKLLAQNTSADLNKERPTTRISQVTDDQLLQHESVDGDLSSNETRWDSLVVNDFAEANEISDRSVTPAFFQFFYKLLR